MRLSKYLDERGLTREEFSLQVGSTAEAVRLWIQGRRIPRQENMEKIAAATAGSVTANDFYLAARSTSE